MFCKKRIKIYAPISGEFIALGDVEDEVFSSGMMGQGFAIEPIKDRIVAPADAEVVSANQRMRHALGLRLKNGCELLIHVGIDTVSLQNQGFNVLVKEGEKVRQGDSLIEFDSQVIKKAGLKNTVMLIVTETKGLSLEIPSNLKEMTAGETLAMTLN
ncbi:PTS sugar transporter subunit IIA [Enterococcus malodoratus]|uniref:PTS system, glucose subfamily, IIA component n=1 Tax=Enterococcus malodoratus ATCC 43197 TaxID=1158601 RepID=R2NPD7_9ENTE|nr:PTS glucose transporter subunit IIA [Enterococcus malodoratus]EOH73877.1 PTS system, glucose subfamily, IIA component [Enterococcus malodoratus ATCC 43197]EOT67215.1 hypothetical protein I585_02736 [Enterococcus malodoratus ATCC 43197]OJG59403.1 PTS system, glucose subfamily, IIA component [Enterococcus malodoratus]SPW90907.1 PTS system, glucose subfamily, IIA component [Enterococcus malodoratus]STD69533.1 PTS system, glucose subfamily, IIA component [Enterococcus malodoratus]